MLNENDVSEAYTNRKQADNTIDYDNIITSFPSDFLDSAYQHYRDRSAAAETLL